MVMPTFDEYLQLDSGSPSGLSWKARPAHSRVVVGAPAFTTQDKDGYFKGKLLGVSYKAHRVVYYLVHGFLPIEVDHKDGVPSNNEPDNLRVACNMHNRVHRGTYLDAGRWRAKIGVDGRNIYLGTFNTEEEAHMAYLKAKRIHHPTAPERCYAT